MCNRVSGKFCFSESKTKARHGIPFLVFVQSARQLERTMNPVALDRQSVVPLYYQIQQQLLQQIRAGHLKVGDPVPSEGLGIRAGAAVRGSG
jgi:hypothetical protein